MSKSIRLLILILVLLNYYIGLLFSNELKVFVNQREVEINKTLTLTVEVDESIKTFELPKLTDFIVIPKNSYAKNKKNVFVYELAPKAVGFYKIPSISLGDTKSIPINIKVFEKGKQETKNLNADFYSKVNAFTDINVVYVNQLCYYTLAFRTNKDLSSNPSYTLPLFQDFWKSKSSNKSGYKLIDGENYFTFEVTTPLYPMREGEITIAPSQVAIKYINSNSDIKFESKPVTIKVLPLPLKDKPEIFSGAVGKYSISSTVSKKRVKINEPITLTITIKGNGNVNSISEPELVLSNNIKKYATNTKINTNNFTNSKIFQSIIIPLLSGKQTIPEIEFAYFDPDLKEYITIATNEIEIDVLNEKSSISIDNNSNNIIENLKQDSKIDKENRYELKSKINLSNNTILLLNNIWIIILLIFLIIGVVVSFSLRLKDNLLLRDVVKYQKKIANKRFFKYLKKSETQIVDAQSIFYCDIDIALRYLLRSKTNCNYFLMLKKEIQKNLMDNKLDENLISMIMNILYDCEKYKFTVYIADLNEKKKTISQLKFIKEKLDKIL